MNGSRTNGYVETPLGIISASRNWFHTTSEAIENFVPGLLDARDLDLIISDAEAWIKSADSLAFFLYIGLVFVIDPWICGLLAITTHTLWYLNKSAFVVPLMSPVLKASNHDGTQMAVAVGGLSYLGISQQYTAVVIGIVLFFLFKIGLWRMAINYLNRRFKEPGATLNDRLLKMLLIRLAIKHQIEVEAIDEMDKRIKELVFKRRK